MKTTRKLVQIGLVALLLFSAIAVSALYVLVAKPMKPTTTPAKKPATTVSSASGTINGHDYVDLGLSVMWATCNVGASSPSDYGDYYVWGETSTKSLYDEENSRTYVKSMGDIAGNTSYDAARANWGGTWRLPTWDEIDELVDKCQREWTTMNGHKGYKITGPNGNSIFLPAAGWSAGSSLDDVDEHGYYWGSTHYVGDSEDACYLYFYSGNFYRSWVLRDLGQSVRPVSGKYSSSSTSTAIEPETTVSSASGTINGHGYVDLGLSVKWAACNIGASSPSDYGNYYAWGETSTKSEYTEDNSKTYGVNMGSIAGNANYDAATAKWGGTWRLPTADEIDELEDKCTREWTTMGGHYGYKVTGPNGNSIFLPAAGRRTGSSLYDADEHGWYWSASPYEDDSEYADGLYFGGGYFGMHWSFRYFGRSVRPVSGKYSSSSTSTAIEPETTVSSASGTINGHGYVDLGLSVKWAACNVGASSPSDYGNYYAWGETSTKSEYTEENSKTCGVNMGSIAGNSSYDAARANWGGTWRLPTADEIDELEDKCTREWTTMGGHYGYKFTGPNGNSIFLPAAGWRYSSSLNFADEYGYYWSATPYEDDSEYAYYFYFRSGHFDRDWDGRDYGRSVRPVSE